MDTRTAAVSLRNVTKTFGAVVANEKVNLDIYKGEILALLGENGSGESTLMNMLSGIYFPDEGQIFINGKEEIIKSPKDALKLGIGMVHQHFKLVDVLSATENIVLGLEGKLNIKEASGKIAHICEKYGFEVDPKQKITARNHSIKISLFPLPNSWESIRFTRHHTMDRQSPSSGSGKPWKTVSVSFSPPIWEKTRRNDRRICG